MAYKPMKSITLPGLEDIYTFVQNDPTLSVEGDAADAKETGDKLNAIEGKLSNVASNVATEQSDVASKNISSGELFTKDGVLYQATQAIAAGAFIVPGTNAHETTVANMLAPVLAPGAITSTGSEYAIFGATDARTYVYPFGLAIAKFYFRISTNPGTTERVIATTTVKPLAQVGLTVTSQEGTYCAVFIMPNGNIVVNTKSSNANGTYHVVIPYPIAPYVAT